MRVLAIVPAYNEEDSVAGVVREVRETGLADVLVVNDGSADDTSRVAAEAGARVLDLPVNLGIGGAVQAGYLFAERHGYDVAVQIDGDGQHLPAELPRLLEPLGKGAADLVLGSRYVEKTEYRSPIARRAGMILFSSVVTLVTGQRLLDTTSGFRAAGRPVIRYLARHYPQDYPEVEALVLLRRAGFRVAEVACRFRDRTTGVSSITASRSAYYVVKVLLAIVIGLFRSVPPREPEP
ncbi:MAG TPA: glycosyltransferase family 2 protein [bacterium]|nr:glycosyltransferase family 2 protein [bacterium]